MRELVSTTDLAIWYGVDPRVVRRTLAGAGVKVRMRGERGVRYYDRVEALKAMSATRRPRFA